MCYAFAQSSHPGKAAPMAKYTPNTQNIIQIIVAAIITMVVLDLLHVF